MAVFPRAPASAGPKQISSPKIATKTVIGMVLGIREHSLRPKLVSIHILNAILRTRAVCLFAMIVSYQLIACPRKKRGTRRVPRNGGASTLITATTSPNTPSGKITRSFQSFLQTFRKKNSNPPSPPTAFSEKEKARAPPRKSIRSFILSATRRPEPLPPKIDPFPPLLTEQKRGPTLLERRRGALRSLNLNTNVNASSPPQKRYPDGAPSPFSPARHLRRMGRVFHFDNGPPPATPPGVPGSGFDSPPTPTRRRDYRQLDDALYYSNWSNEEVCEPPPPLADARISPWSPNEAQFPYRASEPAADGSGSGSPIAPPFLSPIAEVRTPVSASFAYTPRTPTFPRTPLSPYALRTPPSPYSPGTPTPAYAPSLRAPSTPTTPTRQPGFAGPFLLREPRTPLSPPPVYPPPAYLPEVPLRGPGSAPSTPTRPRRPSGPTPVQTMPLTSASPPRSTANLTSPSMPNLYSPSSAAERDPPVSPIVSSLREAIDSDLGTWRERAGGNTHAPAADPGVFVIADDSDSEYSDPFDIEAVSVHTDESFEALKI